MVVSSQTSLRPKSLVMCVLRIRYSWPMMYDFHMLTSCNIGLRTQYSIRYRFTLCQYLFLHLALSRSSPWCFRRPYRLRNPLLQLSSSILSWSSACISANSHGHAYLRGWLNLGLGEHSLDLALGCGVIYWIWVDSFFYNCAFTIHNSILSSCLKVHLLL